MFSISQLFKKPSDFEKKLTASSILNNQPTLNINDLKLLIQGFPTSLQAQTPSSIRKNFELFFNSLPVKPSFRVRMKILATCHVLLDDFVCGAQFAEMFVQWPGFKTRELDADLHRLAHTYFEILQRLANGFSVLKTAKQQQTLPLEAFQFNSQAYYKSINLLNMIFTSTNVFKAVLSRMNEEIVCEIVLLVWNDVIAIYLFLEKLVWCFAFDYLKTSQQTFFQILDLVPDFQLVTDRIKQFYHLNDYCSEEKQFQEPQWRSLDDRVLEDLEAHKQKLKIQKVRTKLQPKPKQLFSTQLLTPQHSNHQSFFSNTTFGYVKRLSTVESPFTQGDVEDSAKKHRTLISK